MSHADTLLRFIQYASEIPALCWDGKRASLEQYERQHCFLPQIQPFLTADSLDLLLTHVHPSWIYESQDMLGLHVLFFQFDGKTFAIGPYAETEWKEDDAEKTLARLGVPASYLLPYKLYYCNLRLMEQQAVLRIITGGIAALCPEEPPYARRTLFDPHGAPADSLFTQEPLDFDAAVLRYEQENEFLRLLEEGHPHAALGAYEQLRTMPAANKYFTRASTSTSTANATGIRTLVRKAAERGGVHPSVVDAISLSYAQRMYASTSPDEIRSLINAMILEFCEAVRTAHSRQWSLPVRKAVSYIDLHLSQEIPSATLARVAGVTPRRLTKQFRDETGSSISRYVAGKRCEKAAELLRHSELPVQEISAHVGYLDNNYFVKVFKECFGTTPTAYRNGTSKKENA